MDKLATDALNRGWNLGFATGKVHSVRRDFDLPMAAESAGAVQGGNPASGFRTIAITAGLVGLFCCAVVFGPALFFGA